MEQLLSYEQYSVLLKGFKQEYSKCKVNKLFMRKELEAMIFAGKLYFERVGGHYGFYLMKINIMVLISMLQKDCLLVRLF